MPHLEELHIIPNLGFALPELLRSLTPGAPGREGVFLCQQLRVLQLTVDHTLNQEILSAFIRSRRNTDAAHHGVVQIKSIRLSPAFLPWEPGTALRDLKEFQDDGVDIFVGDSEGDWHPAILR